MNNEPVAWMFRGYLYEKDPSDWTVHEHPHVPVIPLYTHPVKELTDEELYKLYADLQENYTGNNFPVDLGRVILRKTQEK